MSKYSVEFFQKENGEKPAEQFLLSLNYKMRAKLASIICILEENGCELREPYSKHLEDGIFEIRARFGSNITRVLYFFYYDGHIVLTNGFVKKSNKTPEKEIARAKKYRLEYINNRKESNDEK